MKPNNTNFVIHFQQGNQGQSSHVDLNDGTWYHFGIRLRNTESITVEWPEPINLESGVRSPKLWNPESIHKKFYLLFILFIIYVT